MSSIQKQLLDLSINVIGNGLPIPPSGHSERNFREESREFCTDSQNLLQININHQAGIIVWFHVFTDGPRCLVFTPPKTRRSQWTVERGFGAYQSFGEVICFADVPGFGFRFGCLCQDRVNDWDPRHKMSGETPQCRHYRCPSLRPPLLATASVHTRSRDP